MDKAKVYKGIGISSGIAIGPVIVLREEGVIASRCLLTDKAIDKEIKRLDKAVDKTIDQLTVIKNKVANEINLDHAFIFDAQLMMLKDQAFYGAIKKAIQSEKINADCQTISPTTTNSITGSGIAAVDRTKIIQQSISLSFIIVGNCSCFSFAIFKCKFLGILDSLI